MERVCCCSGSHAGRQARALLPHLTQPSPSSKHPRGVREIRAAAGTARVKPSHRATAYGAPEPSRPLPGLAHEIHSWVSDSGSRGLASPMKVCVSVVHPDTLRQHVDSTCWRQRAPVRARAGWNPRRTAGTLPGGLWSKKEEKRKSY